MIHFTHTAACDRNDNIYVFGGLTIQDETSLTPHVPNNTLLKYNKNDSTWTTIVPNNNNSTPISRNWHSSIVFNNELYIFGGKSNGYLNDMWKYDPVGNTWAQIQYLKKDFVPSPRYGHKSVVIENEMYVYGGYDSNGFTCGDLYVFHLVECTWRRIELSGNVPAPCYHHTMCAIPDQQLIVIYGGVNSSGTVFNQLVAIHCNDGTCKSIDHSHSVDIYGHCSYVEKGSVDNYWKFHVIGGCSKYSDYYNSFYFNINTETLENCIVTKTGIANVVFNNQNTSGVQCLPTFASVVITGDEVMVYGGVRNKTNIATISKSQEDNSVLSEFSQTVPDDIAMVVLSFLDKRELCTMREVSKKWKVSSLSEHNAFWYPIFSSVFQQPIYSQIISQVKPNEESPTGYKQAIKDLRVAYQDSIKQYVDARTRNLLPENTKPVKYHGVTHQYVGKEKLKELFRDINSKDDMNKKFGSNGVVHGYCHGYSYGYSYGSNGNLGAKVVMAGDGASGKTCLLIRVCERRFPQDYVPTVFDNYVYDLHYCDTLYQIGVWDTAGPEDYDRLRYVLLLTRTQ
jgi:N-acetylneuraminic acid mutarotase